MASTLTPNNLSRSISPRKALSSLRLDRSQSRTNSLVKVDIEFNKQLEEEKVTKRSLPYLRDRKKDVSPVSEARSLRSNNRTPKETPNTAKDHVLKSPRAWPETQEKSNWTKSGIEKFSPYLGKRKGLDDKKPKHNASTSFIKKLETPKPTRRIELPEIASTPKVNAARASTKKKEPHYFTFALGKGNNDQLIRKIMMKRYWWKETYPSNTVFDFSWQQSSRAIEFSQLHSTTILKKVVNHLEFNCEIGTKNNLIKNLQPYCERHSLDLFKITPITFILDLDDPYFVSDYKTFSKCFKDFEKSKENPPEGNRISVEDNNNKTPSKSHAPALTRSKSFAPRISQKHLQVKLPDTYYNGCNLWLLKPADFNRGQGINLFNKLSTLEHYLKCFHKGSDDQKQDLASPKKSPRSSPNIVPCHKFVVQKYLERPLLIEGRKFDVRVWVLVDQEMNLHFFKESYLRLSSEVFNLDETKLEDKYVHLTNNAIQKYGENYGKHESGNIISLNDLENYLPKDKPEISLEGIRQRMKELVSITMDSVRTKLNPGKRKLCFELFGYDFIIDAEFNMWIIEVNSNPCIEESNELLKMLVPRMLDDTLRLTIDKVFVPNLRLFNPEEATKDGIEREFPVKGYTNQENLWEQIGSLKEPYLLKKPEKKE